LKNITKKEERDILFSGKTEGALDEWISVQEERVAKKEDKVRVGAKLEIWRAYGWPPREEQPDRRQSPGVRYGRIGREVVGQINAYEDTALSSLRRFRPGRRHYKGELTAWTIKGLSG